MVFNDFNFYFSRSGTTQLSYEVNVIPRFNFPAIFLERIIRSDLPVNLQALACQAERDFIGNQIAENGKSRAILTSLGKGVPDAFYEKDNLFSGDIKESFPGSNIGPIPSSSSELNTNWGVFGKVCRLDRPCTVDEVHLRRFDGLLVITPI